jgi:hypothetical protein
MAGAPERRGEERQRLGLGPGVVAGVWIGAVAGARLIRSHTNLTSVIEATAVCSVAMLVKMMSRCISRVS